MDDTEYRNVRLTEEAYQQLEHQKRAGESVSDTSSESPANGR
ncbi:hypothetical protein [Halostagnicola kamekurae]|uniref:Uncharacterized protein n=1 Tax=Halostagnicola kamekurae TaxID=619731 RepID=A0A1I6NYF3_9EURY|nr:hypothetical protein [Halostagnicola kamekurae]SFS32951.1 hypothetical protein SAMN04488556_0201 [Halostagnicola kamekurae]